MGEIHIEERKIKCGGVRDLAEKPAPGAQCGINEGQQLNDLVLWKMLHYIDGRNEVELARPLMEDSAHVTTGQVPNAKTSVRCK